MPKLAKMVLEKISEGLENNQDEDSTKPTTELNLAMINGRDFSSFFYDDEEESDSATHEMHHTGYHPDINVYKRESEHR